MECDGLETLDLLKDKTLTNEDAEKVVGWAFILHAMENPNAEFDANTRFILAPASILGGIGILSANQNDLKSLKDVTEDYFENRVLDEVISPGDIGVTFDDIGALENVKDILNEFLPLQRPELFLKRPLSKFCMDILLFGPPGTGKTMLVEAVATEASANLINISMDRISSKYFDDGEKYVRAAFSLARKIAPCVIFLDEVDLLGLRINSKHHDAMSRIKIELMLNWDVLRGKEFRGVAVLAAADRPFDLDEATIRRLPVRLMVNLPDAPDRAKILKVILDKHELSPDLNLDLVASMTDGYSGSDLKDLCVAAAHCPIREIFEKEEQEEAAAIAEGRLSWPLVYTSDDIRPLNMADFTYAHNKQVCAGSVCSDSISDKDDLTRWNELYGLNFWRSK